MIGNSYISIDLRTPACEQETPHKYRQADRQTGRRLQEGCILQHSVCVQLEGVYSEDIYQSTRRNILENLNLQQIHAVSLPD